MGTDQAGRIKLQRAKNRGLKIALNKNARYCTNLLHKDARLATWEVRARMALTKLMFKYKHQEEYIERNDAERLTRLQSGPFFDWLYLKQIDLGIACGTLAGWSGTAFRHISDVPNSLLISRRKLSYYIIIVSSRVFQ